MTGFSTYAKLVSLNVNGHNYPSKRHSLAECIKENKQETIVSCLQET
jgi:exonuclease III